jgi:hypothetical protein
LPSLRDLSFIPMMKDKSFPSLSRFVLHLKQDSFFSA